MTTTLAFCQALVAAIKAAAAAHADPTLHDLQVTFGHPGRDIEREGVIVGEVIEDVDRDPAALASVPAVVPVDERYSVDCRVEVVKAGGTQLEAAERATAIVELIEQTLEAAGSPPPILGMAELLTVDLRRLSLRNAMTAEARSSIYRCDVGVHARV